MRKAYSGFAIIMMAVLLSDRADSRLVRVVMFVSYLSSRYGYGAVYQSRVGRGLYLRSENKGIEEMSTDCRLYLCEKE